MGLSPKNKQFIKISSNGVKLDIVELETYKALEHPQDVHERFQECISVLLTEWKEKFTERIAVGVMTLEPWNMARPEREYQTGMNEVSAAVFWKLHKNRDNRLPGYCC